MAGLTYDGIPSTQIDSSNFSGTNYLGETGSFTNVRGTFTDTLGALFSVGTGSPITYGAKIQVGIGSTNAGNSGVALFGTQFANTNYAITITPTRSYIGTGDHAGSPYYISGVRNVSGALIIGPTGTTFAFIAVGL